MSNKAPDGAALRPAKGLARIPANCCIGLIRVYQLTLSPVKTAFFGPAAGCRFRPTCSAYAIACFRRLPFFEAAYYAARRLLRCHPWGGSGWDPAPEASGFPKSGPSKEAATGFSEILDSEAKDSPGDAAAEKRP